MSIFGTDKMNIRKKSDVKKDETVVPSNEDVNVDEVMRKYDRESNTRIWQGVPKAVITSVMVLFSVYCLLMTLFSVEQAETRLARFLAFVIIIGYLMYPVKKTGHSPNHIPWYDIVLMVVGAGSFVYFSVNAVDIMMMGTRIGTLEVVLGICGIAVLIELCRRCVGIPIIVVVGCLLIYAFYWQFSHGADAYRALSNIVQKLFYTTSGVIGTPTNVCYTYIVLFIIFGAFLERTGNANSSSVLQKPPGCLVVRRPGKGCRNFLCTVRHGFRFFGWQYRYHWFGDHPYDEENWLPSRIRRCGRSCILHGWPDHASHHGRCCLPYG